MIEATKYNLRFVLNILKGVLAWNIFIVTLLPILLIVCPILSTIYSFVYLLKKIFGGFYGLKNGLSGMELCLFTDSLYKNPKNGISSIYKIEGKIDVVQIERRLENILKNSSLGDKRFEKLNSIYPSNWLNYPVWTQVKNFNLASHFKILLKNELECEQINEIFENWIHTPFERNKPLWDILIIPGYKNEEGKEMSIFGIRLHHSICDGYSLLALLEEICDPVLEISKNNHNNKLNEPLIPSSKIQMNVKNSCLTSDILFYLKFFFYIPLNSLTLSYLNFFSNRTFSRAKSTNSAFFARTCLPLAKLKKVREILSKKSGSKVPFTSAVSYCIGNALGAAMKNGEILPKTKIPQNIRSFVSLPVPNSKHPQKKMCNHWTYGFFLTPLNRDKNNLDLMGSDITNIEEIITPLTPYFYIKTFFYLFPYAIAKKIVETPSPIISVLNTNLPGAKSELFLCSSRILEQFIHFGLQFQHCGMSFNTISYNGNVHLTMSGNKDIFQSSQLCHKILNKYFMDEVENLLNQNQNYFDII